MEGLLHYGIGIWASAQIKSGVSRDLVQQVHVNAGVTCAVLQGSMGNVRINVLTPKFRRNLYDVGLHGRIPR